MSIDGIKIANAYSAPEVNVQTDVSVVEHSSSFFHAGINGAVGSELYGAGVVGADVTRERNQTTLFSSLPKEGLCLFPKGEVTNFQPPGVISGTSIIYVTVVDRTASNGEKILQNNRQLQVNTSWVLTERGGLMKSDPNAPFVSVEDGVDHKKRCCNKCGPTICFCGESLDEEASDTIKFCDIAGSIQQPMDNIHKTVKRSKYLLGTKKEVSKLGVDYCRSEEVTKDAINKIATRAKGVKLEAHGFLESGCQSDLSSIRDNIDQLREALKESKGQHETVMNKVKIISRSAEENAAKAADKKKKAMKYDPNVHPNHAEALHTCIPIIGLYHGIADGAYKCGLSAARSLKKKNYSKAVQITAAAASGVTGAVVGGFISVGTMMASPYILCDWCHKKWKIKKNTELEKQYRQIKDQLDVVHKHLSKISEIMEDIESNLIKRHKRAQEIIAAADALLEACKQYKNLINQNLNQTD